MQSECIRAIRTAFSSCSIRYETCRGLGAGPEESSNVPLSKWMGCTGSGHIP
jgi:hypothetical protein